MTKHKKTRIPTTADSAPVARPGHWQGEALTAPDNPLLDDNQAARYLLTKPRTLRLWRRTRGLPHIKITHKVIRYRKSDLDAWLARRRIAIAA